MSETERLTCPGSPLSIKRKPVPTPRSTLRKPSTSSQKIVFINKDELNCQRQRNFSLDYDGDSQGFVSVESRSPDEPEPRPVRNGGEEGQGDDILSALEKIPGVGSLRSLGSIGSSSITLDRVKRDSSSHSLGPSNTSLLLLERQKSAPSGTFHHTRRPWQVQQNQVLRIQPKMVTTKSPPMSPASSPIGEIEEDDSNATTSTSPLSRDDAKKVDDNDEMDKSRIQERPLPDLPSHLESIDIVSSEQVYAALLTPEDHYCELTPQTKPSKPSTNQSFSNSMKSTAGSHKIVNGCVTLTGTIRRGKHKPNKTVDIQLTLSPDHLKLLEKRVYDKHHDKFFCGLRRGPHVFILSLLSLPFVWLYSTLQAFILGSMTLFNIFVYYNEERTCCHTLLSPFVLLLYPFWIIPVTLLLGIYAAFIQVSWYWDSWIGELRNPDKGFMNWVCQKLNVPDCAPYQVVVMMAGDENACHKPAII